MPMRKLVIALVAFELLALTACGYAIADDAELTEALYWAREFKAEQPKVARAIAQGCLKEQASSPHISRDGAMALLRCVRAKAETRGHSVERNAEEPSTKG